jgi:hypothetical protein
MVSKCGLNQGGGVLIDGRIWENNNLVAFKIRGLIFINLNWDVRVGDMQLQFGTWERSERLVENEGNQENVFLFVTKKYTNINALLHNCCAAVRISGS